MTHKRVTESYAIKRTNTTKNDGKYSVLHESPALRFPLKFLNKDYGQFEMKHHKSEK